MNENHQYQYDLFVIGAGSGGVRAARMAAALGVRVAVAEQDRTGGTCVNLGCVPKKLYVHAAEYGSAFVQSAGFGFSSQRPSFDWQRLQQNKDKVIVRSNRALEGMLSKAGATLIRGKATITGKHEVTVADTSYSAERILIATGARPYVPEFPGSDLMIVSDQVFALPTLPKRALIVGGGYIATEFTGIFHGLGVAVTQAYRGELFLRGFDQEICSYVADQMRKKKIDLRFNCQPQRIEKTADGALQVTFTDSSALETDMVLAATGRRPNTAQLGLEGVGVELDERGAIKVNDGFQTNVPSIYALGDVIDRLQLTPVALAEAMNLVDRLYRDQKARLNYALIPSAVFSSPNIGTVGLTEEEARDHYPRIDIFSTEFRSLKQALADTTERYLMKLIVDADSDRVVGAHMVGEGAGEIIQGIAVALQAGATKTMFDQTVGIHPTSAEEFVTMRSKTRSITR
ncbi:glutathione-disulfide reductase [Pelovirga terrestris]|uniref:Glutathione-disulfide reductase n=1 Tax=Pelovirga terrestris TaxID=2771352 RepID=A0A8J6QTT0_9BACT|nr:glutathione-disulfide reductase [Pelovirga terrestris]MBD1399575.1 glutathione-disulfide reductase [Pelovirga terrestris]